MGVRIINFILLLLLLFSHTVFAKVKKQEIKLRGKTYQVFESYSKGETKIHGQIIIGEKDRQELYDHNQDGIIDEKILKKKYLKIHYKNPFARGRFLNLEISKKTRKGYSRLKYYYNFRSKNYHLLSKSIEPYKLFYSSVFDLETDGPCVNKTPVREWEIFSEEASYETKSSLVKDKLVGFSCKSGQFKGYKNEIVSGITSVITNMQKAKDEGCFEKAGLPELELKIQAELGDILKKGKKIFKCDELPQDNKLASYSEKSESIVFHQVPSALSAPDAKKIFFAKQFYHELLHRVGEDEVFIGLAEKCCGMADDSSCKDLKDNFQDGSTWRNEKMGAVLMNVLKVDKKYLPLEGGRKEAYEAVSKGLVEGYPEFDLDIMSDEKIGVLAKTRHCNKEKNFCEYLKSSLKDFSKSCKGKGKERCKKIMDYATRKLEENSLGGAQPVDEFKATIFDRGMQFSTETSVNMKIPGLAKNGTGEIIEEPLNQANEQQVVKLTSSSEPKEISRIKLAGIRIANNPLFKGAMNIIKMEVFIPEAVASAGRRVIASVPESNDVGSGLNISENDFVPVKGQVTAGVRYKTNTHTKTSDALPEKVIPLVKPAGIKGLNGSIRSSALEGGNIAGGSVKLVAAGGGQGNQVGLRFPSAVKKLEQSPIQALGGGRVANAEVQWKAIISKNPDAVVREMMKPSNKRGKNSKFNEELRSQGIRIKSEENTFGVTSPEYKFLYEYTNGKFIQKN